MNVEDSFLVWDDLDNALFLDFLKEAEGFGSAPLEESAPVLLADDGFSALAYDVDLLNLLFYGVAVASPSAWFPSSWRVSGLGGALPVLPALCRLSDVLTVLWESGCSLRAGDCLEVVSLRRIFIYLLLIAGYPHCAYIVGCGCEGSV